MKKSALKEIDEIGNAVAKELVHYLHNLKEEMFIWNESELPPDVGTTHNVRKAGDLIRGKIEQAIDIWCTNNKDSINCDIENKLKKEFRIIEEDLKIKSGRYGSVDECQSNYGIMTMLPYALFKMNHHKFYTLCGLTFFPCAGLVLETVGIVKIQKQRFAYPLNRKEWMTKWAYSVLEEYITEKTIVKRIEPFLNGIKDMVAHFCDKNVPKIISDDNIFIKKALKKISSFNQVSRHFHSLQCQCEMIACKIEITLVAYFPERKMSFLYIHNAKFVHDIGKGNFSDFQSAIIVINNEETIAAVKTLRAPLDDMCSHQEVSKALILRSVFVLCKCYIFSYFSALILNFPSIT